jgi:dihydroorotase
MILIRGGSVFTAEGFRMADVLIEDGCVVTVEPAIEGNSADIVNAEGCLVGPGFVDIHVHLREPGHNWKEDLESGSRAAAAGGFTAVVAMPNTDPPIDEAKVVEEVALRGSEIGLVEVAVAGALTRDRAGVVASDIEGLHEAGVRIFTDDGDSVEDTEVLRGVMTRITSLPGAVVSQHAEDNSLTSDGHLHEGSMSSKHGIKGLPSAAEVDVVRRDLELVRETGARYHCQHVSSGETVELIRQAKDAGLPVTAEVTPHHLSFDDSSLATLDADYKMYPPLRSSIDRRALRKALIDGTIDVVATDHAPHTADEKASGFEAAPRGVIGLETAAAVVSEILEDPKRLFEALSVKPASIAGLGGQGRRIAPGEPANIVVFDPERQWSPVRFWSRSSNSPYKGHQLKGRTVTTIYKGNIVFELEEEE